MRKTLVLLSPMFVAVLFMVPRLVSPNFGLLDDAATLKYAREIVGHFMVSFHAIDDTGRFIPFYWMYYSFVYLLGGANSFLFLLANTVALAIACGCIVFFVRFRGGSTLQAWASGIFFVVSGPALESYYTNSQEGPPQIVCLGVSFLLLAGYSVSTRTRQKLCAGLGMYLALLLANCTMETSVAMAGIGIAWAITARLSAEKSGDRMSIGAANALAIASILAAVSWFVLRSWFNPVSIQAGSYTADYRFELQRFVQTGFGWLSLIIRDFPHVIVLALPVIVLFIRKQQTQVRLILDSVLWMLAFMGVYLPWKSALEYYMLPFSVGCAIFAGVALGQTVDLLRATNRPRLRWSFVGLIICLFLITCFNNWTNGRYQIMLDRTNSDLIDYLAKLPLHSQVLINIREPNEYVYEIGVYLSELRRRSDVSVDYFRLQTVSPDEKETIYYVVTPHLENQLLPSVRYAIYEQGASAWSRALLSFLGSTANLTYRVENRIRLIDFGLHRLLCPFVGGRGIYCNVPRPFIDGRLLTFGWSVYRVSRHIEDVARPAVFIGDGTWLLQSRSGHVRQIHFGEPGDYPLSADFDGDGFTDIAVFRPKNKTWYIDTNLDGKSDLEFRYPEMRAGDIPLAGDWDRKGKATPAYFRPEDATWHFMDSLPAQDVDSVVLHFGKPGDIPLVGDWDGDGRDTIGIYRKETGEVSFQNVLAKKAQLFSYNGDLQVIPVAARWSGSGVASVAFVSNQQWRLRLVNCPDEPSNPAPSFHFGPPGGRPLGGNWR